VAGAGGDERGAPDVPPPMVKAGLLRERVATPACGAPPRAFGNESNIDGDGDAGSDAGGDAGSDAGSDAG
jgi:hypothetical protein